MKNDDTYLILIYWKYMIGKIIAAWLKKTAGVAQNPIRSSMWDLYMFNSILENYTYLRTGVRIFSPVILLEIMSTT